MPVTTRSKENPRYHHQLLLDFIGAKVAKYFDDKLYKGEVITYNGEYWRVRYEDDDVEDYDREEVEELMKIFNENFTTLKRKREGQDLTDFARNSRTSLNTLTQDSLIHICSFLYDAPNGQYNKDFLPSCIQDISNLGMCSQDLYQVYKAFLETIEVPLELRKNLDVGKLAFFATFKMKLVEIEFNFNWGRDMTIHKNDLAIILHVFKCCNLSQLRYIRFDKFDICNDDTVDEKYYDFCFKAVKAVGYITKNSLFDYFRKNKDGYEWAELKHVELPLEFLRFQLPFLPKLERIKVILPPPEKKKKRRRRSRSAVIVPRRARAITLVNPHNVKPMHVNILSRALERMPELKTLELDWIDDYRHFYRGDRLNYLTLSDLSHPRLETLIVGEYISLVVKEEVDCPALKTVRLGTLCRDDTVETFEKLPNEIIDLSLKIMCDNEFKHDELNIKLNELHQLKNLKILSEYWSNWPFHEGEATLSLTSQSLEAFSFLGDGNRHNLNANCPNLKFLEYSELRSVRKCGRSMRTPRMSVS